MRPFYLLLTTFKFENLWYYKNTIIFFSYTNLLLISYTNLLLISFTIFFFLIIISICVWSFKKIRKHNKYDFHIFRKGFSLFWIDNNDIIFISTSSLSVLLPTNVSGADNSSDMWLCTSIQIFILSHLVMNSKSLHHIHTR